MPGKEKPGSRIKGCCSRFYENDLVSAIFGENFHPGGEALTLHLGKEMGLDASSKVLDVACGAGTSAILLAKVFGCHVIGIDLGAKNIEKARNKADGAGLSGLLDFKQADAERLDFEDNSLDAIICECALCTFPDPDLAASEMYRVLRDGGRAGITDMTLSGMDEVPEELNEIVLKVLCIGGALPPQTYAQKLKDAGFGAILFQDHSYTLTEILERVHKAVKGLKIAQRFASWDLEMDIGIRPEEVDGLIKKGMAEVKKGTFGYGLFVATKELD